jgi:hypothetical protein
MVVLACWGTWRCIISTSHRINSNVLLLCSKDNTLKPLTGFLESIGIPKLRIASVMLLFAPIMLSDFFQARVAHVSY